LGSSRITTIKTGSLGALLAMYIDIWQKTTKRPKKEKETRKYYKCDRARHLIKDCRLEQKIKNRGIWEDSDNKDNNK